MPPLHPGPLSAQTSGPTISGSIVIGADMEGALIVAGLVLAGGSAPAKPTVTTASVTNIATSTASSGGNVTSDGGASVTARGVCWSTSANPTTSNSKTTNGTGKGSFTSSITGLSPGTTYHVRAYATNSAGTSYGSDNAFTTNGGAAQKPTVNTSSVTGNNRDECEVWRECDIGWRGCSDRAGAYAGARR